MQVVHVDMFRALGHLARHHKRLAEAAQATGVGSRRRSRQNARVNGHTFGCRKLHSKPRNTRTGSW